MFTRNYYGILAGKFSGIAGIPIKTATGYSYYSTAVDTYFDMFYTSVKTPMFRTTGDMNCVLFGTGTTAPTMDDYKMESPISSGMTASFLASATTIADGVCTRKYIYTLTNGTTNDITISEIGAFAYAYYAKTAEYGDTNYTSAGAFMLDHTLLDEPVTIPADGVGQVTYTITMDYPTE